MDSTTIIERLAPKITDDSLTISEAGEVARVLVSAQAESSTLAVLLESSKGMEKYPRVLAMLARALSEILGGFRPLAPTLGLGGTGNSNRGKFNITTATAFVLAALPDRKYSINKFGNTGRHIGSSNLLAALGLPADHLDIAAGLATIQECGMSFTHAPACLPILLNPQLAAARRAVPGAPLFHLLGPLLNPLANRLVVGAYNEAAAKSIAAALPYLGMLGVTFCGQVSQGQYIDEGWPAETIIFFPHRDNPPQRGLASIVDFGRLAPTASPDLQCEDVAMAAQIIKQLFAGKLRGDLEQVIAFNSALIHAHMQPYRDTRLIMDDVICTMRSGRVGEAFRKYRMALLKTVP